MENNDDNREGHVNCGPYNGGSPCMSPDDPRQKYLVNGFDPADKNKNISCYSYDHSYIRKSRIKRVVFLVLAAIAVCSFLMIVRCSKAKSVNSIEKELEKKYGMDFTFVDEKSEGAGFNSDDDGCMWYNDHSIKYYYFEDEYGNILGVKCEEDKYTDYYKEYNDYENTFEKRLYKEYLSILEDSGIEVNEMTDYVTVHYCKFNNYVELEKILKAVGEAEDWMKEATENYYSSYIKSSDKLMIDSWYGRIYYYYYGDGAFDIKDAADVDSFLDSGRVVGNNHLDSEDVIKEYRKLVREGKINDSIPDD